MTNSNRYTAEEIFKTADLLDKKYGSSFSVTTAMLRQVAKDAKWVEDTVARCERIQNRMMKNNHIEFGFAVTLFKRGREVRRCFYSTYNSVPFLTMEDAMRGVRQVCASLHNYIIDTQGDGRYDAFEINSPVRRIVSEWENDEGKTEK